MTDDERIAAETAQADAEAKAQAEKEQADATFEAEIEDLSDEDKDIKRAEREASILENSDYEKEIAAEEARKAKAAEAFKKRKEKRLADDGGTPSEDEDDDKPLTRKEGRELIESTSRQTDKILNLREAERIVRTLTSNELEVKATLAKWENRIFPQDMQLSEQVEEMYGAVNRKRIIGRSNELARTLQSRDTAGNDIASSHRDPMEPLKPKLTPNSPLKDYTLDKTTGVYSKKLKSGKTHFVNPKALAGQRKSWVG